MDSNGSGRRRFLKSAAALAGVAAGAGAGAEWAARGQSAPPEAAKPEAAKPEALVKDAQDHRELLRRGARMSVDHITYYTPIQDYGGNHHPGLASLRAIPRLPFPRHRCRGASPYDPRHGGPSVEFQHGRSEAPAFRIAGSFRGVPCQQLSHDPQSGQSEHGAAGPVHSRDGQQQRMDRSAAFRVVEHGRRAKRGELAGL